MKITIHKAEDFEKMRVTGRVAAETLDYITEFVKPGITTGELNDLCHNFMLSKGATPATLGYRGYTKSICTSVNHVVCHGIPGKKTLKEGDIINIDVTTIIDGWFGDTSRMFFVGDVLAKPKRLVQVTYDAMMLGIESVKPGATFGDIGHAIQQYAEKHNYSVVRDYCGHGIGKVFHAEPSVVHYGKAGTGPVIKEGMFFTIEPMINTGSYETILSSIDGWTVTTRDKSLSAQFEHTIGVTKNGFEIFTLSPKGYKFPPYN
jgi:methionyl aminopeptidase